jgi:hypothetical protein
MVRKVVSWDQHVVVIRIMPPSPHEWVSSSTPLSSGTAQGERQGSISLTTDMATKLGQMPPKHSGRTPGTSGVSIAHYHTATPVANLPLGLRVIGSTGSPREPNEEEIAGESATPDLTNVEALRWISELSPFRRRRDVAMRAARRTWYDRCITLFSVPGLYAAIIKRLGFPGGCRRRE